MVATAWTNGAAALFLTAPTPSSPSVSAAESGPEAPTLVAPMPDEERTGFRMESAPELEVVFGDIDYFEQHINRFYSLHDNMNIAREQFSRNSHTAMLALQGQTRGCPVDQVAAAYVDGRAAADAFRRLGIHLETTFTSIRNLDQLGETTGLTPDYRWKVNRARPIYQQALRDLSEMRGVFNDQVVRELKARGCSMNELEARGSDPMSRMAAMDTAPGVVKSSIAKKPTKAVADLGAVPASTATFFVDNATCTDHVAVYVDETLLGKVAPGQKAAFQALNGRHSLCTLAESSGQSCGDTGTVRTAFVHDGWTLERHCSKGK